MKKLNLTLGACIMLAAMSCSNDPKPAATTEAADTKDHVAVATEEPAPAPPDSATSAKAWMEYMTPGEMHKMMAKGDGEWNEDITMWMDPAAPPTKSTSTATNKMILNGLYQESIHKGNMMGMPFEGRSTMGYDNARRKFISTWIDNMGSGIMVMEGDYDQASKTVNSAGKQTDPVTGKQIDIRETFKIVDDNTQLMEMYCTPAGGKEFKTMEIRFTRKGKKA